MIEEIKLLLDTVDGVADLGLWALVGFVVYKAVIYLSTTGAIVFCFKYAFDSIIKIHENHKQKPQEFKLDEYFIGGHTAEMFKCMLSDIKKDDLSYIHENDIEEIRNAIKEYRENRNV